MALTRDFKETVQARASRDKAFRVALLQEGIELFISGDTETGKAVLRDYINAVIGFEQLAELTGKSDKGLMRMFSKQGNPSATSLFSIIKVLQEYEHLHFVVKAKKAA